MIGLPPGYNEKILLTTADQNTVTGSWTPSAWPMGAYACERCGACVVDYIVHDRWHTGMSDPTSKKEP